MCEITLGIDMRKTYYATYFALLAAFIINQDASANDILCKDKKTLVITARTKGCKKTETRVQSVGLAVNSKKATPDNTTGLDVSVTRQNATGGTLNTTGLNLSVIGDTGGDSTNVGLIVSTAGADTNYSALFRGGNVGIGVNDPDELLELAGRFHLGQSSAPSTVSDKLYNLGGTLYWSGQAVAVGTTNSGTITGVTAGTGLSGGGSTGNVTLSVNTGTSANNIVQLNSSAELPAVSGVNVTNLNATSIGSGTISDSRLSTNVSLLGNSIGLTSEVAGILPIANGGTGAASLSDAITLGTHTTGNYVQSIASGTGISGGGAGAEAATLTLGIDQTASLAWTGTHSFSQSVNFGTASSSPEAVHVNGRVHLETSSIPTSTANKLYNVGGDLYFNGKNLSTNAAGGDITAVSAGTGLTGGDTTGDVTLAVNVGTTANKIVQLDGSARLPAVNGSLLTALDASNISTGTLAADLLPASVTKLGSVIDLTSEVENKLPITKGGTGSDTLTDLIALKTNTTGNYVRSLIEGTGIQISSIDSEGDDATVSVDTTTPFSWSGTHTFSGVTTDITTSSNQDFAIVPNGTGKVGIGTTVPNAMLDTSTSTSTSLADTRTGSSVTVSDTGAVASGVDSSVGQNIAVTHTGPSGGTILTKGLGVSVTADTGGISTATGLSVDVSGADTNYAALFNGGFVGIGTTTPTSQFESVSNAASGTAASFIGNRMTVANTGAVSTGVDVTKGLSLNVSRTLATGGTISTTGLDISVIGDAGGVSQTTGLNVSVASADKNVAASFSGGSVSIGGSSAITNSAIPSGSLIVDNGALCVDDGGDSCSATIRNTGTIYATNTTVQNVDVAEEFPIEADDQVEAGDIVIANTKKALKCTAFTLDSTGIKMCAQEELGSVPFVTRSRGNPQENKRVLGVVSTKPGITLGGFGQEELINYKKVPLALAGRVPVKVTLENGPIDIGDRITTASQPGAGKKAEAGDFVIGIALEPLSELNGNETILVLVK
jgi:hypothetical protein